MEPHVGETVNWEQIQWVLTTIVGAFSIVYGAILTYVFKELERLHAKDDSIISMVLTMTAGGDDKLRLALEQIKDRMDADRQEAAKDRANIAVMMATKNDIQNQFDRFSERIMAAIQQRPRTRNAGE